MKYKFKEIISKEEIKIVKVLVESILKILVWGSGLFV